MATGWTAGVAAFAGIVALGAGLGWWPALVRDPHSPLWDWIERAGWIAGALSLPTALLFGLLALREDGRTSEADLDQIQPRQASRLISVDDFQPVHAGVHRAGLERGDDRADVAGLDLPRYIARDHDVALRAQLRAATVTGGMVMVVGASSTGKSRSLYEAVREICTGWQVLIADDAAAVRQAIPTLPARTVVWLDDTPTVRYLTAGGLTRVDVLALIERTEVDGPVIVVNILWRAAYLELTTAPVSVEEPETQLSDPWRDARLILSLAMQPVIEVPTRFSSDERNAAAAAAQETSDRRLAEALADKQYGLTQHLAGAPQLIARWDQAFEVNMYGWAVITAAADARRMGVHDPLSNGLLAATAASYLDDSHYAEAPPTWWEAALEYATRPLAGGVRALFPIPGAEIGRPAGFEIADYLLEHIALVRQTALPPASAWTGLIHHAHAPGDVFRLAINTDNRMFYGLAEQLYRRVAAMDLYPALRLCQLLVGREASDGEILAAFRQLIETGAEYGERVFVRDKTQCP